MTAAVRAPLLAHLDQHQIRPEHTRRRLMLQIAPARKRPRQQPGGSALGSSAAGPPAFRAANALSSADELLLAPGA